MRWSLLVVALSLGIGVLSVPLGRGVRRLLESGDSSFAVTLVDSELLRPAQEESSQPHRQADFSDHDVPLVAPVASPRVSHSISPFRQLSGFLLGAAAGSVASLYDALAHPRVLAPSGIASSLALVSSDVRSIPFRVVSTALQSIEACGSRSQGDGTLGYCGGRSFGFGVVSAAVGLGLAVGVAQLAWIARTAASKSPNGGINPWNGGFVDGHGDGIRWALPDYVPRRGRLTRGLILSAERSWIPRGPATGGSTPTIPWLFRSGASSNVMLPLAVRQRFFGPHRLSLLAQGDQLRKRSDDFKRRWLRDLLWANPDVRMRPEEFAVLTGTHHDAAVDIVAELVERWPRLGRQTDPPLTPRELSALAVRNAQHSTTRGGDAASFFYHFYTYIGRFDAVEETWRSMPLVATRAARRRSWMMFHPKMYEDWPRWKTVHRQMFRPDGLPAAMDDYVNLPRDVVIRASLEVSGQPSPMIPEQLLQRLDLTMEDLGSWWQLLEDPIHPKELDSFLLDRELPEKLTLPANLRVALAKELYSRRRKPPATFVDAPAADASILQARWDDLIEEYAHRFVGPGDPSLDRRTAVRELLQVLRDRRDEPLPGL